MNMVEHGRGRPREFNIEEALDKAISVFSERGYHATSIGDLEEALGLSAGSIYKAFKDKRTIFVMALERYTAGRRALLCEAVDAAPNGREKVRATLDFYAKDAGGEQGKRGCLIINTATNAGCLEDQVGGAIRSSFQRSEGELASLIALGQADGSIPVGIDAKKTALAMVCLQKGMRVIGKVGRAQDEMSSVTDTVMKLLGE